MLSSLDEDRIAAAVDKAETGTSGEIICVLAGEVSKYREVPLAWAAAVALAIPPIALAFGVHPLAAAADSGLWLSPEAGALESQLALALGLYAILQVALFVATFFVVHIPAVRRRLTPRSLKRHRVAQAAHRQFAAIAAHAEGSDTGVMIFVAVDDRQVQVLAERALHQKADEDAWSRAAQAIGKAMKAGHDPTAGIIEAVEICGAALAAHFPADGPHRQIFSNRPIEV
jgi:putative membrane protein